MKIYFLLFFLDIYIYIINVLANRDATLYNLGVGACAQDALDGDELKYVYHENGQQFIQVLLIGKVSIPIFNCFFLLFIIIIRSKRGVLFSITHG